MNAKTFASRFLVAALFLGAGASPALAKQPRQWTVTSLGGEYAATVNNRGDIGGFARVPNPNGFPPHFEHGVIWQNGVMTDIGANFGTPPGQASSDVPAVNEHGTFVVSTPDGVMTLKDGLFTPLGFRAAPHDINDKGVIVGSLGNSRGSSAFVYRDGVLQDLGTLGGTIAGASSINDHGLIVGFSTLAGGSNIRGFIYANGSMKPLQTFGGGSGRAHDVNSHGVVVGEAQDQTGRFIAFTTDESGVLRPFLDMPGSQSAVAINKRGAIVGSVNGKGYLYEDGEVTILDDLPGVKEGWFFLIPTAINDRGWIVGTGNRRGGAFTGEGFVLVPR